MSDDIAKVRVTFIGVIGDNRQCRNYVRLTRNLAFANVIGSVRLAEHNVR